MFRAIASTSTAGCCGQSAVSGDATTLRTVTPHDCALRGGPPLRHCASLRNHQAVMLLRHQTL